MRPGLKKEENGEIRATVSIEWLFEYTSAVDRASKSCGGICTCINAAEALVKLTHELLGMSTEELRNHCRL